MIEVESFSFQHPRFLNLLERKNAIPDEVAKKVETVLKDVKMNGDKALYDYMQQFDQVEIPQIGLLVTEQEFVHARESVSDNYKEAVKKACENLMKFHTVQKQKGFTVNYDDGVVLQRKYTPIQRVAVVFVNPKTRQ